MRSWRQPERSSSSTPFLVLVVFLGNETRSYSLPLRGRLTIGRAPENDICIDDTSISRRHAIVNIDEDISVEDLGSANGTSVHRQHRNAAAETERVGRGDTFSASVGDVITFGSVRACIQRGQSATAESGFGQTQPVIIDPIMKSLMDEAYRAAKGDLPILLLGETGVGKEVLARLIHQASRQAAGKFVAVHVAAMSESLLESELFGYEKGAFTGATEARAGIIEFADGGTVLLDELGEIPLGVQVKLLRVLEERSVTRIGSRKARTIDVRFVAATHRNLEAEIALGRFRADLYYRINGISLRIPPLRERRADIVPIAETLLRAAYRRLERSQIPVLSAETQQVLEQYDWPGNVRELRNVMDRVAVFCESSRVDVQHLPSTMLAARFVEPNHPAAKPLSTRKAETWSKPEIAAPVAADEFRSVVEDLDRRRVLDALATCGGNQTRAAEMLGMSRRTLVARLDAYGLPRPRKGTS
jgi:two-component system, NtrC family, response regulator AtoC